MAAAGQRRQMEWDSWSRWVRGPGSTCAGGVGHDLYGGGLAGSQNRLDALGRRVQNRDFLSVQTVCGRCHDGGGSNRIAKWDGALVAWFGMTAVSALAVSATTVCGEFHHGAQMATSVDGRRRLIGKRFALAVQD